MCATQLNRLLQTLQPTAPLLVFITGASGAGKSYFATELKSRLDSRACHIAFFDSIGVPEAATMVATHHSTENWQKQTTFDWVEKLTRMADKKLVVLEGQFHPDYAVKACQKYNIENYVLFVLHANRKTRERRLNINRNQPELVTAEMNNWANVLKQKTLEHGGTVLDTSDDNIKRVIAAFCKTTAMCFEKSAIAANPAKSEL